MTDVTIRRAEAKDFLAVMRVLDGANLESDASSVEGRIEEGRVLVATDAGRVIGALVAVPHIEMEADGDAEADAGPGESAEDASGESVAGDATGESVAGDATGAHVEAVAVRLRRRGQGIGTALMRDAAERWRPLTADFYPGLSGFYEKLEFDIEKRDGQYRGILE